VHGIIPNAFSMTYLRLRNSKASPVLHPSRPFLEVRVEATYRSWVRLRLDTIPYPTYALFSLSIATFVPRQFLVEPYFQDSYMLLPSPSFLKLERSVKVRSAFFLVTLRGL